MVKALHAAGIEVILDVVYNHTAEGNHLGPTLSMRGIDNRGLLPAGRRPARVLHGLHRHRQQPQRAHPQTLQLIMDSLRYWVTEMHVDGFRFDLASTLAREFYDVDRLSTFFEVVQQDPVVGQVKLIAEPWDVGPGGYQVGNFPPQWTEWNGKYRDTVRDFWRGEPATLAEFASRITGSADLYQDDGRQPFPSINFVTAHDGFTLNDLVSYNDKHNEANGEDNRDGESHNRSWNCGVEGPTDDPEVLALRARQRRNFLATLLLVPGRADDLHGDELGRTQHGNNNALLPGQRDQLGRLGERRRAPARVHPQVSPRCAGSTRCSGAAGSSPAGRCAAAAPATRCRTWRGSPRTAGRWPARTGATTSAGRSRCSSTARASGTAARRPAAPTTRSCCSSTRTTADRVRHAARRVRREVGDGHRHRDAAAGRAGAGRRRPSAIIGRGPLAVRPGQRSA